MWTLSRSDGTRSREPIRTNGMSKKGAPGAIPGPERPLSSGRRGWDRARGNRPNSLTGKEIVFFLRTAPKNTARFLSASENFALQASRCEGRERYKEDGTKARIRARRGRVPRHPADRGKRGSLATSAGSCWMMRVAFSSCTSASKRSKLAFVCSGSASCGGTCFASNCCVEW
jgi:hypothetical protein